MNDKLKKIDYKKIIGIILSIIILFLLFKSIKLQDILLTLKNINPFIFVFSFIVFGLIKFVNTFRYKYSFNIKKKTLLSFSIISFCNTLLGILPFRTGEISYLNRFKKFFGVSYAKGSNYLIKIRLSDYIIVGVLFLFSIFYSYKFFDSNLIIKVSLLFLGSLLFLFVFFFIFSRITKKKWIRGRIGILINSILNDKFSKKKLIFLSMYTLLYWVLRNFMGYIILSSLGIKLDFFIFLFINNVILLIGLLPINVFFGFGIVEAGFSFFLVQLGYEYSFVMPLIFFWHMIIFITSLSYGIIGYIIMFFLNKQKPV